MKLIEYLGKPGSLKKIKNIIKKNKKGKKYLEKFNKENYYNNEIGLEELSERIQYEIIVSLLKGKKFKSNNLSSVVKEILQNKI